MSVSDLRQSYEKNVLLESQASASPLEQFSRWFDEAQAAKVPEPNAMTLATVDASGQPSARIVLIKGYDERGFTFSPTTNRARARTCWPSRAPACCSSGSRWNARCASRAWWKRSRPRIRRLLPQPARRLADRRLGLAPEPAHHPRRTGGPRAGIPRPLWRPAAAPAALGRLPPETHRLRILAGPPVAPARPPALRPRRRRLEDRTPIAVEAPSAARFPRRSCGPAEPDPRCPDKVAPP